jgi:molybdenum cofactor synthesis domain-containing protein
MKQVPVEEAIGMVLAHDMTKVIPHEFKGALFRKGHVITKEDIEELKNMGKNHIFIYEMGQGNCHENDAAKRIAEALAGANIALSEAKEGKVDLISSAKGMLKVQVDTLDGVNEIEGIILATRHRGTVVEKGEKVAGAKIIPLVIKEALIKQVEQANLARGKVVEVIPFHHLKVGIVVTGSEVYYGRIQDGFAPVLEKKVKAFGGEILGKKFAPDDLATIEQEIKALIEEGCELVLVSGGMSVDPDDLTPTAITRVATEVITYGSPVLPGAMFMMAYAKDVAIVGVPACGMFNKTTVLDLMLPYLFTKEKVTKKMILQKAHGGLCLGCEKCVYPHCEFGKG